MSHVFSAGEIAAIKQFWSDIQQASKDHGIAAEIVVGVGSRESDWGTTLEPRGPAGTGDFAPRKPRIDLGRTGGLPPDGQGFGRGLMQLDWDAQSFARTGPWQDAAQNIAFGCQVLESNHRFLKSKLPTWSEADLMRASIAAYNCGAGKVLSEVRSGGIGAVDRGTTHGDYSHDVLDRASSFANLMRHGVVEQTIAVADAEGMDGSAPLAAKAFDALAA